jgi:hypothetical protein
MEQELGKIERPEVGDFKKGKKIFLIPLLYPGIDSSPEYAEKFELYWKQVMEQVNNLESKIGPVKRVYHESISIGGKEGLQILEKLNQKSYQITSQKCQDEAEFTAIEDKELAEECMDWERCLVFGFMSDKAARTVSELYIEASKKRFEHIKNKIDETLKDDEIAILFIREGHSVQFPNNVEVFSVAPPALDDIHRWLRDRASREKQQDAKGPVKKKKSGS